MLYFRGCKGDFKQFLDCFLSPKTGESIQVEASVSFMGGETTQPKNPKKIIPRKPYKSAEKKRCCSCPFFFGGGGGSG